MSVKQKGKRFKLGKWLADRCQISHVTIRKYISYLEERHYLKSHTVYTKVGRPYKVFERQK